MHILIPAYEPNNKLIKLIEKLQEETNAVQIVVVDDGSGIKYQHIFNEVENKDVKILVHKQNMGKGEAIKTGIKYIKEIETEGIVTADCDRSTYTKGYIKCTKKIERNKKRHNLRR